jgi:hypothetical protein
LKVEGSHEVDGKASVLRFSSTLTFNFQPQERANGGLSRKPLSG